MIKYLKILTTSILLFPLWGLGGIFAQNFPVQCTPIVTPPYTLSWVEYGSSPERLKVQLLLKDLTKPSVEVSLRIRLKGIGVIIENTPDFYTSSPITLLPGVPVMLSGAMLRENFKYENLIAQGVDLEALYAGASLPSGFYQWEITDFLADQRQVSNVGMAMMTVFKNNPPQITFPQNNAVLMNTGFQSINFTWMPRHRYSTNAAAGTVYTFKIYEIPNEEGAGDASQETDPNVIVNSGVLPLFSTQSFGTNYTYKPSDPTLVPGRRYVIQVQAADINGNDEFENNGLSEVSTFSFGNPSEAPAMKLCKKPNNFLAEKLDEQSVQLTWQESNSETPIDYLVSYKTENEGIWTERIVSDPSLMLVQLAPAKYQFKVSARCTYDNKSVFTNEENLELSKPVEETPEIEPQDTYTNTDEPVTPPTTYEPEPEPEPAIDPITTPIRIIFESESLPDSLKNSGLSKLGSLPVLSDKPSLAELKNALKTNKVDCSALLANYQCGQNEVISVPSGDIIQVKTGDEIAINSIAFEVVELDGSGNGSGIVKVPMFNNAKFGVEFKGIKVAKGGCVVAGQAELSHVDFALLSEKERVKLADVYKAFNLVLTIADSLAPQIAKGINDLNDKLFEKKQNTKKLLVQTNVENLTEVLTNCTDISSQAKTLQDSLDKAICLVKAGKLKAKLSSLEDASKANIEFMNKLGPALANCQGKPKWEDWTQKPCSGPCMPVWEMDYWVDLKCKKELEVAFGVGDKSKLYDERNVFNMTYKDFLSPKYVTENESKLTNTCIGTLPLGILEPLGVSESVIKNFYPPLNKKPISSVFQNEVDLYRFVYLNQLANVCAKDYLPEVKISEYFVDKKYLEVVEATRYMLAATESAAGLEGEEFQEAKVKLFTRLFEENNSRIDEDIKLISREESRNTLATILSVGQILLPATAVDNAIGVIAGKLISRLGRLPSKGFKYLSKGARLVLEKVLPKEIGVISARYSSTRRITNELYDELRLLTPSQGIRDKVNEGIVLPIPDEALPGLTITKRLHADHIVSMEKIARMEGFEALSKSQQVLVLNNPENFIGLSETANTSKGSKSFSNWTKYVKGNINVNPAFRLRMMEREINVEKILQKQIDNLKNK